MTKKQELVDAFIVLGNLDLSNNIIVDIEKFTCHIFGYPKNKCINGVLKAEFDKKCELKPGYNSLALNLWIQQHYHHAQTYYCNKLNGCVMQHIFTQQLMMLILLLIYFLLIMVIS